MSRAHLLPTALIAGFVAAGCDLSSIDPGGGASSNTIVTLRSTETPTGPGPEDPPPGTVAEASNDPGSFTGTIKFEGSFNPLPPLVGKNASKVDPTVCAKEGAIPDESMIIGKDNGVANVFVYLQRAPRGVRVPKAGEQQLLDQKGCIFIPHALIWRTKEDVPLKNSDGASHNVQTTPQLNDSINENMTAGSSSTTSFRKAEPVPFPAKCAIHSWMRFYALVLDHPWAAITDTDGKFEIKDLPPGEYSFRVWHERGKMLNSNLKVKIEGGKATSMDLSFDANAFQL